MATAQQEENPIQMSEADYLAFEEASDTRHEFVNGNVYAMAGSGWKHAMSTAI